MMERVKVWVEAPEVQAEKTLHHYSYKILQLPELKLLLHFICLLQYRLVMVPNIMILK